MLRRAQNGMSDYFLVEARVKVGVGVGSGHVGRMILKVNKPSEEEEVRGVL